MIFIHIIFSSTVILICLENAILMDLKSKWRNIKKKSKNILAENLNKPCGISQIGPKPGSYLDYPGSDIEKLKQNKILWDLYYKCLEENLKNINKNKIFQAKVMTTFKSSRLK